MHFTFNSNRNSEINSWWNFPFFIFHSKLTVCVKHKPRNCEECYILLTSNSFFSPLLFLTSTYLLVAVSKWDEEALNSILYNTQPPRPLMNRRRLRAYSTTSTTTDRDVIRRQGRQILEILNSERLMAMAKVKKWITSTTASQQQQQPQQSSSSSITDEDMMHFQQMTKLVHFLYTPLLFLPRYVCIMYIYLLTLCWCR